MADEAEVKDEPEVEDEPIVPDPTAAALAETARLREHAARLEGEIAALRAAPPPKSTSGAAPRNPADMSVAELDEMAATVQAEIDAGSVTPGAGLRALGRIEAHRLDRERQAREATERPIRTATKKLDEYISRYPDLKQTGSDLLTKVRRELNGVTEEFGFDITDPRAQLIAVERVVGGHKMGGTDASEIARRKTPVGGTGGGAGGEGGGDVRKPDPLKEIEKLYPDQIRHWERIGYSRQEMLDEAPYVLARRGTRPTRVVGSV